MKTIDINKNTMQNEVATMAMMFNQNGSYGEFGGAYVPPELVSPLKRLAELFDAEAGTVSFQKEYVHLLKQFVGRPSSLYFAERLSKHVGARIYLKREDLNQTGSHKINNAIGQVLMAKRMGTTEIIAETGAGQHGVATATVAAMFGIRCKIFMGAVDVERQSLNVRRIKLLGAEIISVTSGTATLKDAVNEALDYYVSHPESFYLLGSQVGPDPYPRMVGYFQSVIGYEARNQILEQEGRLPDSIFACVGGGSNAIGLFSGFLDDMDVRIYGAEGGGFGVIGNTAATLTYGSPAIFQGTKSYCLVDDSGVPISSHSVAAGLDYPGVSPQHAFLKDEKRVEYHSVTDQEAIDAYRLISGMEGIIPAIESSHAIALAVKILRNSNKLAIINLSGRGDKDVERDL